MTPWNNGKELKREFCLIKNGPHTIFFQRYCCFFNLTIRLPAVSRMTLFYLFLLSIIKLFIERQNLNGKKDKKLAESQWNLRDRILIK